MAVVDVVGFWALRLWKRQLLFEGKLCHSVLIKTLTQSHSPSHSLKCTCTHIYIHIHTLAHVALHLRRCKWEKFASRVFGVIFRHQLYLDCKVLGDGGCYCSSCRSCSWWQKPALDTPSPERPPSPSRKVYLKIKNVWRLRGRSLKLRLL